MRFWLLRLIPLLFLVQLSLTSAQDVKPSVIDSALGYTDCITNLPRDWVRFAKDAFRVENIPIFAGIALSTTATIIYDRELYDGPHNAYLNSKTLAFAEDRGVDIGDGKFQFGIALGFGLYGWLGKDYRALRTASQVTEVILAAGTVIQVLKHSTGRESPFTATTPTGRWKFFPNQIEYMKHIPHYDAYPSGHVCTALATLTVVMDNYPEATWLPYIGYPAIAWLGYSMVGQGIHWVSDYPLSIAIGYGFAKAVTASNNSPKSSSSIQTSIYPCVFADGTTGVSCQISW